MKQGRGGGLEPLLRVRLRIRARPRKRPFGLLLSLLLGAGLSGCGLETLPYLSPPSFVDVSGALELTDASANAGPEFLGYQVLYRIFEESSAASSLASKSGSYASLAPDIAYSTMKADGLKLMQFSGNGGDPSILDIGLAEQGDGVSFSIKTATPEWTVSKDSDDAYAVALRINEEAFDPLALLASDGSGDPDYTPATATSGVPTRAYVVLYAVAIGTSLSSFGSYFYSLPVLLSGGSQNYLEIE